MLIQNKLVKVFDIEVFPNVFHVVVKDTETKEITKLEISERRNDIDEIVSTFYMIPNANWKYKKQDDQRVIFCGYNVLHYDTPIINYIIDFYPKLSQLPYWKIVKSIYNLSKEIINSVDNNFSSWSRWKYLNCFESLDLLTMLYSQKLRVGLKEMQVTMQYENVQEYEGNFDDYLPVTEIDNMVAYNINDVNSTEELLYRCQKDIDLRIAIEKEYGVKVLNKDGVNIGMEIITQKYLEKTGLTWKQIKDLRSPCDKIDLNEIILPIVKFEHPILQELLVEMKKQIVSPGRKGYERHFLLDGLEYCVGVGGKMYAT